MRWEKIKSMTPEQRHPIFCVFLQGVLYKKFDTPEHYVALIQGSTLFDKDIRAKEGLLLAMLNIAEGGTDTEIYKKAIASGLEPLDIRQRALALITGTEPKLAASIDADSATKCMLSVPIILCGLYHGDIRPARMVIDLCEKEASFYIETLFQHLFREAQDLKVHAAFAEAVQGTAMEAHLYGKCSVLH